MQRELEKGISVEKEHDDLYTYIMSGKPLSRQKFYTMIAKTHLKEVPDYYTKLSRIEKDTSLRSKAIKG